MQAIYTKFIGPTDFKGSRYKASCDAGSVTLEADDRLDSVDNHVRVARALIQKLGWFHDDSRGDRYGRWFCGGISGGGYAFVCGVEHMEVKPDAEDATI